MNAHPGTLAAVATIRPPQPGSRLLKCECIDCGYLARVTQKWIDKHGPPRCAVEAHGQMVVEKPRKVQP